MPAPNLAPKDLLEWGRLESAGAAGARQVIDLRHIDFAEAFVLGVQNDSRGDPPALIATSAHIIINAPDGQATAAVRLALAGIVLPPGSTPLWFPTPIWQRRLTIDLVGVIDASGELGAAAVNWYLYSMARTIRADWKL